MRRASLVAALALLAAAEAARAEPLAVAGFGPEDGAPLVIWGTTDIEPFSPALEAFSASRPDLRIDYQQWVSTPLFARSLAVCAGEAEAPDLIVSSSIDQQIRLVNDGCARSHRSALTAALPRTVNWRDELFGVTVEPAVMVYNRDLVPPGEAPRSRFDLIDLLRSPGGAYAGRVATYDIEASGLGYLFAFADSLQATTFGGLIEAWDDGDFNYQHISAVTECGSGKIFVVATKGHTWGSCDDDSEVARLYELGVDADGTAYTLSVVGHRYFHCTDAVEFSGAAGVYITNEGRLSFYTGEKELHYVSTGYKVKFREFWP
jgi:hypothetical protein